MMELRRVSQSISPVNIDTGIDIDVEDVPQSLTAGITFFLILGTRSFRSNSQASKRSPVSSQHLYDIIHKQTTFSSEEGTTHQENTALVDI
jgi:hypothetical protein